MQREKKRKEKERKERKNRKEQEKEKESESGTEPDIVIKPSLTEKLSEVLSKEKPLSGAELDIEKISYFENELCDDGLEK